MATFIVTDSAGDEVFKGELSEKEVGDYVDGKYNVAEVPDSTTYSSPKSNSPEDVQDFFKNLPSNSSSKSIKDLRRRAFQYTPNQFAKYLNKNYNTNIINEQLEGSGSNFKNFKINDLPLDKPKEPSVKEAYFPREGALGTLSNILSAPQRTVYGVAAKIAGKGPFLENVQEAGKGRTSDPVGDILSDPTLLAAGSGAALGRAIKAGSKVLPIIGEALTMGGLSAIDTEEGDDWLKRAAINAGIGAATGGAFEGGGQYFSPIKDKSLEDLASESFIRTVYPSGGSFKEPGKKSILTGKKEGLKQVLKESAGANQPMDMYIADRMTGAREKMANAEEAAILDNASVSDVSKLYLDKVNDRLTKMVENNEITLDKADKLMSDISSLSTSKELQDVSRIAGGTIFKDRADRSLMGIDKLLRDEAARSKSYKKDTPELEHNALKAKVARDAMVDTKREVLKGYPEYITGLDEYKIYKPYEDLITDEELKSLRSSPESLKDVIRDSRSWMDKIPETIFNTESPLERMVREPSYKGTLALSKKANPTIKSKVSEVLFPWDKPYLSNMRRIAEPAAAQAIPYALDSYFSKED